MESPNRQQNTVTSNINMMGANQVRKPTKSKLGFIGSSEKTDKVLYGEVDNGKRLQNKPWGVVWPIFLVNGWQGLEKQGSGGCKDEDEDPYVDSHALTVMRNECEKSQEGSRMACIKPTSLDPCGDSKR